MKKHYETYYCPKYQEMKSLGYVQSWVEEKYCDILYSVLGGIGSPYSRHCSWYKERYGNFQHPTKVFMAAYTYGVDNLNQFGGEPMNTIYPAMLMSIRCVTSAYTRHSGLPELAYVRFNSKFVDRVIGGTLLVMEDGVVEWLSIMRSGVAVDRRKVKAVVERTYVKKPAKREYKIMQLADRYE
jgi:hypothetical protein